MTQTVKYAKAKTNRAQRFLESVSDQIAWQPGNTVKIYRPHAIAEYDPAQRVRMIYG